MEQYRNRRARRQHHHHRHHHPRPEPQLDPRHLFTDSSGALRVDLWRDGIAEIAKLKISPTPFLSGFGGGGPGSADLVGAQWTQIGPAPLREQFPAGIQGTAGRVYDTAIDPSGSSDQVIYIATLGGIWKTTNGGMSWAPKTDRLVWNQMSAVAIDPTNPAIIYAGAFWSPGASLFRSIDGGETWAAVGGPAMNNLLVTRIVALASGVVLVGTANNGLYRSVDHGTSFGSNAPSYNNNAPIVGGYIEDLHVDTGTATTVYACVASVGILASTDSGATFPTNLFSNPGAPAAGTFQWLSMSQSTNPNNHTMYASVAASGTVYLGLYVSTNTGGSWSAATGTGPVAAASGQFGNNQTCGVDPQDPKRVYIGFENLWMSSTSGSSFTEVSSSHVHVDHHALAFSPSTHWAGKPTRLYVGCDGGFATSGDGGTTWTNLNEGVATSMITQSDIGRGSAANNAYSYAAIWDNGGAVRLPSSPGTDWQSCSGMGSDGWAIAVDPSNAQNAYYADVFADYAHTTNAGGSSAGGSGLPPQLARFAVDPWNSNIVYAAGGTTASTENELFQSTNTGASFALMHTFPATISAIGTDPSSSSRLWVGLADGTVWLTTNTGAGAGATWTSPSVGLPMMRTVTSIAVDPFDPMRVAVGYAGVTGIPAPSRTQHVFLTESAGASWVDASGTDGATTGNLPDRPILGLGIDPGATNGLFGVISSGTAVVAVGLFGTVLTSPDGITWTEQAPDDYDTLADVAWTGSQFVAVGLGGVIMTSPDGTVWTSRKTGPSWEAVQGVAWSGAILVATSASFPTVYTSPDGVTWTEHDGVAPQALLDIEWSGTQFVAVGYGGTIITSPNGTTWAPQSSSTTDDLVSVVWSGSQFVVGGLNGTILTSPDGIVWTPRTSPTTNEINALAWSGAAFVGVLDTGEILRSTDGIGWTLASVSPNRLLDVTWTGSLFVAVGDMGTIYTSPDGTSWTDRSFGATPWAMVAATDSTVLKSSDSGASWQVLGVGLPTCQIVTLSVDWQRDPTLVRVGTSGRSMFELTTATGPRVAVMSNLAFGNVASATTATLTVQVFNVGSAPLVISSFARTSGSATFSVVGAALPATLAPGAELDFTVKFAPTATGNATAMFQLASNDPSAPTVNVAASGVGI